MKKQDNSLKLSKEQTKRSVQILQSYLEDNFEIEVSNLAAEMLLEHITKKIGLFYYNNGVIDSMKLITEKTEDLYLIMKDE